MKKSTLVLTIDVEHETNIPDAQTIATGVAVGLSRSLLGVTAVPSTFGRYVVVGAEDKPKVRVFLQSAVIQSSACSATLPMNWTDTDRYVCAGADRHHNGCHVALPGVTPDGTVHGGAEWTI